MSMRRFDSALIRTRLLATLVAVLLSSACATDRAKPAIEISLHPNLPALTDVAAAPLHAAIADGDTIESRVRLDAEQPFHWFADAGNGGAAFAMVATFEPDLMIDAALLTVWDWNNRPVAARQLAPSGRQCIGFNIEGQGVYLITLDGLRDNQTQFRLARSFAVGPSNESVAKRWGGQGFWLGICGFPGRYHWLPGGKPACPPGLNEQQARELEASLMARLGLQLMRLDVSMMLPQDEDAKPDWQRMDASVQAYTARGFKLALQVMMPPDWAIDPNYADVKSDRWRYPRRQGPYRRYVRELVERYGKHAAFVQVFNEPDQPEFWAGQPQEYIEQFEWARQEIRRLETDTPIANGGYAFVRPDRVRFYVEKLKGRTELAAYHSHGNLAELKRDFEPMRKLHAEAGYVAPRFVNTECGYAAWRLDHERTQAAALVQKMLYAWAHGDEGMLLFASRMTRGPGRPGAFTRDFGLLDYHFCPRFAYGAVAAFVDTLAGARFERVLAEDDNLHAYLFRDGKRTLVTLFAAARPLTVSITTDAAGAALVDIMGNTTVQLNARQLEVNVTPMVRTLVLKGATRVHMK